jgi:LmbE family N-acetylglucosaminyl deacetylase
VSSHVPPELAEARSAGAALLFLSPHLDDAVLSCGALIRSFAAHCPLTVMTVFTAAGPPPHTRAARSFLRQCAVPDAATLYSARRSEDARVLDELGVAHTHLGYTDALFRRREAGTPLVRHAGRLLPEVVHRYPTYRFDIAKGRIAAGDRTVAGAVADRVRQLDARWVFCPLGIGRHVDHLIVRAVGERFTDRVVYYADFPYSETCAPDPGFLALHRLAPWTWSEGIAAKEAAIRGYRSQVDALFAAGRIPLVPETYYSPRW